MLANDYIEKAARVIPFTSRRKNGGNGGESEFGASLIPRELLILLDEKSARNTGFAQVRYTADTRNYTESEKEDFLGRHHVPLAL
jgi:hypothetical protein